jgi:uncharacterized protein YbdZ (MbtH family)
MTELPQQSRDTPQHHWVVVDDKDNISMWQKFCPWPVGPTRL